MTDSEDPLKRLAGSLRGKGFKVTIMRRTADGDYQLSRTDQNDALDNDSQSPQAAMQVMLFADALDDAVWGSAARMEAQMAIGKAMRR